MVFNVCALDRALRVILGIALLSVLAVLDNPARWIGLIGLVPLVTGVIGWCPAYRLLGIDTCRIGSRRTA
jgi:hypothetical protein